MQKIASFFALAMALAIAAAAAAPAPRAADAPKALGKFDDWTAATHQEGGQLVCYAFTRATNSSPPLHGRGEVVLTVAERPNGRDAVALSAGFAYAANAEATLQIDHAAQNFYTAQRSAFARDGAATVRALRDGHTAIARSPGPHGTPIVDTFSLRGFPAAYAAILKVCPR